MKMYVYEDGDFVGEENVDLENKEEISNVMMKHFGDDDWEKEVEEEGEIWIGVSDCEYMVNRKY